MNCTLCKSGDTASGKTTVTLQRESTIVIVKEVPAEICDNCGEYYLDETVAGRVYKQAEDAVARHAELEIIQYAA